jgi:hypothetical protein
MAVSGKNIRLVTTITKATDNEIRRMSEHLGVTYRVAVSMALSVGLKMMDVSANPLKYMTPDGLKVMDAIKPVDLKMPSGEEERIMDDARLALAADERAARKASATKKHASKKKK